MVWDIGQYVVGIYHVYTEVDIRPMNKRFLRFYVYLFIGIMVMMLPLFGDAFILSD